MRRRKPGWAGALRLALAAAAGAIVVGALGPISAFASPTPAADQRDVYVLLSGGGTPLSNNYSQYLQAKALAGYFARVAAPDAWWVFFGIGNREDAPPRLADAHRELKRDGLILESWVPGPLPRNRPATRESFLGALREEILPAVHGGGTLYLFVGDHGELVGRGPKRESAITLWQLKQNPRRPGSWMTDDKEILRVSELRDVLRQGLGAGRVVFCMTQCHSGGFHGLGVEGERLPPSDWFTAAPDWVAPPASAIAPLRVAGFTATNQDSVASGCDPDPDPERWAGYERFFPESLLGVDLLAGEKTGAERGSLAAAHEAATLIDGTIDLPRATSEYFLETWAQLIEKRLTAAPHLSERTRRAVAQFRRAVNTGDFRAVRDAAFHEREAQFGRFTAKLAELAPPAATLLRNGTRRQLEQAIRSREGAGAPPGNRRGAMAELRRAWSDTLRPAWKTAVLGGEVRGLDGAALDFEKHLLRLEERGRDFLFGRDDTPLLNELYWQSGYAEPATLDVAKAEAVARWAAERRARIVAWGSASADAAVRAAAEKIGPGVDPAAEPPRTLSRRTAAERALFYRRVLAAWQFLLAMDARAPLAELAALIELEQTPLARDARLPAPVRASP